MHDAPNTAAGFTAHRYHVATVSNGDFRIGYRLVGSELPEVSLKQCDELGSGFPQAASGTAELRRGIILDSPVRFDRAADGLLEPTRRNLDPESRHSGSILTKTAQCGRHLAHGFQGDLEHGQLRAIEHATLGAEGLKQLCEVGDGLRSKLA